MDSPAPRSHQYQGMNSRTQDFVRIPSSTVSMNEEDGERRRLLSEVQNTDMDSSLVHKSRTTNRLLSLDIFRGAAVGLMILVDNPGDGDHVWTQLDHAPWNGWTMTDLVFPFFLFAMGVASAIVAGRQRVLNMALSRRFFYVFRRSILLFLIGVGINALALWLGHFPSFTFSHLRVLGILQRLAICYFIVSVSDILSTRMDLTGFSPSTGHTEVVIWPSILISVCMLILYSGLMYGVDVPGCGRAQINVPSCTTESYFDKQMMPNLMAYIGWDVDPEGLLTSLTASLVTMSGYWIGLSLEKKKDTPTSTRAAEWMSLGFLLWLISKIIDASGCPYNKRLFSPSFVFLTVGMALIGTVSAILRFRLHVLTALFPVSVSCSQCLSSAVILVVLGILVLLSDVKKWTSYWSLPLVSFGMNPLLAFVGMDILAILLTRLPHIHSASLGQWSFWSAIYEFMYNSWLPADWASFLCALTYTLFWMTVVMICHAYKWYWRL